jgi:hypothetical protein
VRPGIEKEKTIPPPGQRSREPRPRLGEILIYEPDRAQGLLYSLREGRTLPFKLSDSPGLPGDLLRPGIQVHFYTAPDDSGNQTAVQLSLEAVASLDARLRYVARRAARRAGRTLEADRTGAQSEGAGETSVAILDDIAFMGAGVSQVSTRGRRGLAGGRRDRGKAQESIDSDESGGEEMVESTEETAVSYEQGEVEASAVAEETDSEGRAQPEPEESQEIEDTVDGEEVEES